MKNNNEIKEVIRNEFKLRDEKQNSDLSTVVTVVMWLGIIFWVLPILIKFFYFGLQAFK